MNIFIYTGTHRTLHLLQLIISLLKLSEKEARTFLKSELAFTSNNASVLIIDDFSMEKLHKRIG